MLHHNIVIDQSSARLDAEFPSFGSLLLPAEAFVSLATNDSYSIGALTLGKSLRDSGSTRRLALMVTSGVTGDMR